MVCMRVAFHENDGNHENNENEEDNSDGHEIQQFTYGNGVVALNIFRKISANFPQNFCPLS